MLKASLLLPTGDPKYLPLLTLQAHETGTHSPVYLNLAGKISYMRSMIPQKVGKTGYKVKHLNPECICH